MLLHADSEDSDPHAQSDESLPWAHKSFYWFCHAAAHYYMRFNGCAFHQAIAPSRHYSITKKKKKKKKKNPSRQH